MDLSLWLELELELNVLEAVVRFSDQEYQLVRYEIYFIPASCKTNDSKDLMSKMI